MSTASAFMHEIDARKPPLAIEAALQQIASAAHLRGVEITKGGVACGTLPASDLMRALRGAWKRSQDNERRLDQVGGIIRGTATRLKGGGPVQISKQLLGIAVAYAKRAAKETR